MGTSDSNERLELSDKIKDIFTEREKELLYCACDELGRRLTYMVEKTKERGIGKVSEETLENIDILLMLMRAFDESMDEGDGENN